MKKVVILNGAGKTNGNTSAMIKAFSDAAIAGGNEVREFKLQSMNIKGCLDCGGCRRREKNSSDPCVQKDDMETIYPAFKEADVIVFASPVYWWDITGTLKTAIDRLYGAINNFTDMPKKKTVLLMTSGGSTIAHMADWYSNFERWMGWKNIGMAMNDMRQAARIGSEIH